MPILASGDKSVFQLTAARRRLGLPSNHRLRAKNVSTHSRPKAAGQADRHHGVTAIVSTHSRPKAVGSSCAKMSIKELVSTRSRPKAAGLMPPPKTTTIWFQLTAARRRLDMMGEIGLDKKPFQLTAARRRLVYPSRPTRHHRSFNSQPPEGGWLAAPVWLAARKRFNSQPPEGGWDNGHVYAV